MKTGSRIPSLQLGKTNIDKNIISAYIENFGKNYYFLH
jgi:hypothetical protein